MIECSICRDTKEVIHLSIYSMGSEGTNVCLSCRIKITEFIRALMSLRTKGYLQGIKDATKEKTPQA